MISKKIHITGLVQGVGFRPFVYRIALREGISGVVENRNDGVYIVASGSNGAMEKFETALINEAPPASDIRKLTSEETELIIYSDFSIISSSNVSEAVTGVSPDIAVCKDCLDDMNSQTQRIDYPLINCTNCGPRFSIIRNLPYDRSYTTMSNFEMCPSCRQEYSDVSNRRFHAQPVACNNCGPEYYIAGDTRKHKINKIIALVSDSISSGNIVALKGTGGYHLLCDPYNRETVELLRSRKERESKPFAIMCRDMHTVKKLAKVSYEEELLLDSWQKPIVLLESQNKLPDAVSSSLSSLGVVLPYMPFHYLLFKQLRQDALIFTSANISDEPVIKDDSEAIEKLDGVAELIVAYNREIYNRADDSVTKVMAGKPVIIRRSRSYTPSAININKKTEGIFAAGAELVNSFALGKGSDAILSQYIGDLKNKATMDFYRSSYNLFSDLFRFSPESVACDLHPDYLSSHFAREMAEDNNLKLHKIQHHHAHIAACMAEHKIDEAVIGLAFDGVGLGTDGNIWGGEILVADYNDFNRAYHLDYVPVVGADTVALEPWRSGLAYMNKYLYDKSDLMAVAQRMNIGQDRAGLYLKAIDKGINAHLYSSTGRLFDAVAAICGIVSISGYHAEAPVRLESVIDKSEKAFYDYSLERGIISFGPAIEQIVEDLNNKLAVPVISARFHNSLASALIEAVGEVSGTSGIRKVVLSGGSFQNSFLTSSVYNGLLKYNYSVYLHKAVPQNDGGLALGQMAIAASRNMD